MNNNSTSIFTVTDPHFGVLIPISQPQAICEEEPEFEDEEGLAVMFTYPAAIDIKDANARVFLVIAKGFTTRRGAEFERIDIISASPIAWDRSTTRFAIEAETEITDIKLWPYSMYHGPWM